VIEKGRHGGLCEQVFREQARASLANVRESEARGSKDIAREKEGAI
jgi:hypothetical protein